MKTLDQIEPRKEVNATNTPGDANALFNINSPGSYYLSGNITGVNGKSGIIINADDVTLDLNGFQLKGVGTGVGIWIVSAGARRNIAIRNGTIRDWSSVGVDGTTALYSHFENLRLYKNGVGGLVAGAGSRVRGCIASYNAYIGILLTSNSSDGEVASGGVIEDCVATGNQVDGILASNGTALSKCTANSNSVAGFSAGDENTLTDCTARLNLGSGISAGLHNTVTNCTSVFNSADGINAGEGTTLTNCTATGNGGQYGIFADDGSTITNCTARANTSVAATSSGIHAEPAVDHQRLHVDEAIRTPTPPPVP